jgi:RNA polymerase sigma-70 factor (ECF subfamily)
VIAAPQQGEAVDRQLVVRAQEGDHDAFSRLAAASIGRLNAIARLILHDYGAAEDAVQDAFVDAWRNLRGLRDPDAFDAWLTRILVRTCQDARRRASRRGRAEVPWLDEHEPAFDDAQVALAVADQLERGLRRLTIEQRTVLVLAFYLDLSQADAAATLGIPVGTMKSRLNRSIVALRAALDAEDRRPMQPAEQPT